MHCFALPSFDASIFLIPSLASAFGLKCINGFHDTANAVATVIYTSTLKRWTPTLPAYMFLGAGLFAFGLCVNFRVLGAH
jgi:phosphate/sulfate permease